MLRQLWRLSRTVEAGGERMSAPAVYAERGGEGWRLERAKETGYEGVACVDDAARLAVLLLRAYDEHRLPWALEWAEANLRFLTYMQQPDGSFANFILNWEGEPNLTGRTSAPGGVMWLVRAMWALASAYRVTGEPRYLDRYRAALPHVQRPIDHADMLGVAVLSALEVLRARPSDDPRRTLRTWCEQIAACQRDGVLLNHPTETAPHLWGYVQPGVLALASRELGVPEWLAPAEHSARTQLVPFLRGVVDRDRTMPYDVGTTAFNLRALREVTGDPAYGELEAEAIAWFRGRNSAGLPVYDPALGIVFDGTDGPLLNENSGAESNIEGGMALFDELPWNQYQLGTGLRTEHEGPVSP